MSDVCYYYQRSLSATHENELTYQVSEDSIYVATTFWKIKQFGQYLVKKAFTYFVHYIL